MLNMNSEFVTVKIEPTTDSEDSLQGNESKISALGKQIEFIPIKTEISESPPHSPVSLAAEEFSAPLSHEAVGSPVSLHTKQLSVPVKQEGIPPLRPPEEPLVPVKSEPNEDDSTETTLNPATLVAVTYKIEPTGYDDNGLNQFDDPALILPNTSNILDNDPAFEVNATRNGRYVCPICCKRFSSKSNMQRHQQLHEKVKLSCSFCGKQYYKLEQLESHVATHTGERRHTCPDCGKKFKTPSHLKQHRRVHMEKPYQCGVCQRRFAILPYLVKHEAKNRCKEPNNAPLVCNECGKLFRSTFLLKSHLRRHSTEKPYSCDLCKMMFKYKSTIVRHLQMHDGIRPYKCKYCPKTFTHAGLIKPHLRTHTGEKPYQCPICFKYFTHKHNMNRHAVRHSKIKNLTCEVCLKRFPKESRLIYHMKTHTNERPFSCGVCTKKFSHKQNIIRHYGRKHPGEVYFSTDTDASVAKSIAMSLKQKQCFGNEVIVP